MLNRQVWGRDSKLFEVALEFIQTRTSNLEIKDDERAQLKQAFMKAFQMSEEELQNATTNSTGGNGHSTHNDIDSVRSDEELQKILPTGGLLRDYVEYTSHSEAPLVYHVMSFLCAIGAVINRRIWLDMGYYRVFPAIGVIILGPSGIKKTSATDIVVRLLGDVGTVKLYSEKLTPEALIEGMKGDATGLLYAPEMTVFLNKVKYNEGLIQLITRFMDCPDRWESGTIMRGKHALTNIAISSLMCSTSDWFIRSTPADSFGGGFIARNLLVVQESSSRCEPIPNPGDPRIREGIIQGLAGIHSLEGAMSFSPAAMKCYVDWYRGEHQVESKQPDHEIMSTYFNRKPDHIKRLAISLHMAEHSNFILCLDCFERALSLLDWLEQFIPKLLEQMFRSSTGEELELVYRIIRQQGTIGHSDLVRKVGYTMDAQRVKGIILSLREAGQVVEVNDPLFGHSYQAKGNR
jgi:hypothetical protein